MSELLTIVCIHRITVGISRAEILSWLRQGIGQTSLAYGSQNF